MKTVGFGTTQRREAVEAEREYSFAVNNSLPRWGDLML